ncbi:MAG: hypothetical protein IJB11_07695 [Oscillospiraceae bacterium]|nr:hypothetical protein [Oscillospiraceae bacterium]
MEEKINQEELEELEPVEAPPAYTPRPKWQIVAAWVGVAIMLVSVALYYWHIASGGRMR